MSYAAKLFTKDSQREKEIETDNLSVNVWLNSNVELFQYYDSVLSQEKWLKVSWRELLGSGEEGEIPRYSIYEKTLS